jgi:uncharacterized membrane protein YfcA
VAHATSLGVAFVTSAVGSWRYARTGAVDWQAALAYSAPGILSAFVAARILASAEEAAWIRAGFGAFLLVSAWEMARRARNPAGEKHGEPHPHSWIWLIFFGLIGGALSALLGIGGGLLAVPVLLYVGKFPVRAVAPTALAAVCLTTLAGGIGYATAGPGPAFSSLMAGFLDLRMAIPLVLGAVLTVPIGVRVNRQASPPTLYWSFAVLLAAIGLALVWQWVRELPG